jgi:hypothetical protein
MQVLSIGIPPVARLLSPEKQVDDDRQNDADDNHRRDRNEDSCAVPGNIDVAR